MLAQISKVKQNHSNILVGLAVVGVFILAIIVRIIGLSTESAWIDEAYSINLAQHSIGQIIQGTAADQHPPLYYLLLHIWMLFGNSVVFTRLFSALLGLLLIIQVIDFGWKVDGARLGIGAGLLLAISPLHVWYSQEARQYMLLACLTTASTIELWKCLQGRRRWLLLALFDPGNLYSILCCLYFPCSCCDYLYLGLPKPQLSHGCAVDYFNFRCWTGFCSMVINSHKPIPLPHNALD